MTEFHKEVAKTYRQIKEDFNKPKPDTVKPVDGSIKEEINADLDRRIKDYENR